ncbi:MAG: lectin like domain-containing protein [Armatimonadota bacterium]|nr:lectin like domain-containing protein [bacterium]
MGAESGADGFFGLVPEPFVLPTSSKNNISAFGDIASSSIPSSYDLRTTGKLTSVKNQGTTCGSCWAFATCGSLESSLLPDESWNFSENNLKNNHGFNYTCCNGGNRAMSTAYLARWDGPMLESDDPYDDSSCTSPTGLSPAKHVQDVVFIPNRTGSLDNSAIKTAVMTYGAIYTSFYYSSSYYKSANKAYYYSTATSSNHAVCIVGWDDNYSASKFSTTPGGNGAFIVRNSWGSGWGDSGYFYISYYDANIGKENAAFFAENPDNYDTQYGYDMLGPVVSYGSGSSTTAWFAMAFTADSSSVLRAVSWYSFADASTYELSIRASLPSSSSSGNPSSIQTGTISKMGYHTVPLDIPVQLAAGTKYYCVVKLTTPNNYYPVAVELPYADYSTGATANTGETYFSLNGKSWTDFATVTYTYVHDDTTYSTQDLSACMKAFATHPIVAGISDVKAMADGAYVQLVGMVVSAVFGNCIYVAEPEFPSGIRVESSDISSVSVGDSVTVTGKLGTHTSSGIPAEREITLAIIKVKVVID